MTASGRKRNLLIIPAIVLLIIVAIYFLMHTALPQYAGRVPALGFLFLLEWFIYLDILSDIRKRSSTFRLTLSVLWWLPMLLFIIFLTASAILPLQKWSEWPRIYLPGIALVLLLSQVVLLAFFVPSYLFRMVGSFFKQKRGLTWRINCIFRRLGYVMASATLLLLLAGMIFWVYNFRVHEVSLRISNLPSQFEGLRIVQLSDIHLGSWASEQPFERAMKEVMALEPDLIVFTGDLVNYSSDEALRFTPELMMLKAPLGVYAILGNHDYGDYTHWPDAASKQKNMKQLDQFYKSVGWKLLKNESVRITRDTASLLLAGIENWSATPRFYKYGDMVATLKGQKPADLNILLSHDPTHWDAEVHEKYPFFNLTLSGHTHGMQLGIEMFGIDWSPSEYLYKEWAGLYSAKSGFKTTSYLYVNRGLGHIGYPGRVGILPEITLITLFKADNSH